jgi:glycosyltransferase involved in cell wall biosynthesis
VLAPPWIPVPPPGYGGIEAVIGPLCEALVARGHDVTLFAAPGSWSTARVEPILPRTYPGNIERALFEVDHVARAFARIEEQARAGSPFDVIHDHCGFTAVAMADRIQIPIVHTMHGPFDTDTAEFYRHHGHKAHLVGLSHAQLATAPRGLEVAAIVPNPVDPDRWRYRSDKDDYLLFVGRMHPTKGPDRAIAAARLAGAKLVLAGPVQPGQETYFQTRVAPHLDGEWVRYVGEVGGTVRRDLFARARALVMPIRWPEPFGLVMVEALVCGTPVIAFAEGAATEIVRDSVTGFLVTDEQEMAAAVAKLSELNPADCRADAVARFSPANVAASYEQVYAHAIAHDRATAPIYPLRAGATHDRWLSVSEGRDGAQVGRGQ